MSEQLKSGQHRLPLTNIQNKSKTLSENMKMNKTVKTQSIYHIYQVNNTEDECNAKKDCIITDSHILTEEEENLANHHHYLSMQKALKEAIDINEKVVSY
jgi:hypothetical protein